MPCVDTDSCLTKAVNIFLIFCKVNLSFQILLYIKAFPDLFRQALSAFLLYHENCQPNILFSISFRSRGRQECKSISVFFYTPHGSVFLYILSKILITKQPENKDCKSVCSEIFIVFCNLYIIISSETFLDKQVHIFYGQSHGWHKFFF